MLKWILIVVFLISGSLLGYFYVALQTMETAVVTTPARPPNAVRIVHSYQDGIHRYAGRIKLPHSCFTVATEIIQDTKFPEALVLSLKTKNNLAEEGFCSQIPTQYPFEIIADAPKTATITMKVDGRDRPFYLVETNWTSPIGTTVNTVTK